MSLWLSILVSYWAKDKQIYSGASLLKNRIFHNTEVINKISKDCNISPSNLLSYGPAVESKRFSCSIIQVTAPVMETLVAFLDRKWKKWWGFKTVMAAKWHNGALPDLSPPDFRSMFRGESDAGLGEHFECRPASSWKCQGWCEIVTLCFKC